MAFDGGQVRLGLMASERDLAKAMLRLLEHPDIKVRTAAEWACAIVNGESLDGPLRVEDIKRNVVRAILWAGENVRRGADWVHWVEVTEWWIDYWATPQDGTPWSRPKPGAVEHAVRICGRKPGAPRSGEPRGGRADALLVVLRSIGLNASAESVEKTIERNSFGEADIAELNSQYVSTDKQKSD